MKKDDDFIDEDGINDLIKYSEDDYEDNPTDEIEIVKDEEGQADNTFGIPTYNEEQNTARDTDEVFGIPDADETETEEPYTITNPLPYDEDENEDVYGIPNADIYDDSFDEVIIGSEKKSSRVGIIIGILIGLIAVAAFISIDTGIIGNYKNTFSQNFSKIFGNFISDDQDDILAEETPDPQSLYNTEVKSNVIVPLDGANETEFLSYRGGVICASMNHLSYIDETGTLIWETNTSVVDPILRTEGNYILLAEKNRNKICLYNDRNLVYDVDDSDSILTAELSSNGDVVVVTNKSSYKGGISVYNKSGAQIFSWASGSDTVICADISASSRRVAVALLNTDTTVKSIVSLFDVNQTESYAKIDIADTVIFNMQFVGNTLNAFGDNRLTGISESGKIIYDNIFSDVALTHSAMDERGVKLLSFDDGNIPIINRYNKRGTLKNSITLSGVTDFIDVSNSDILYNIDRDVYFGGISAKVMSKFTSTMDIKNLFILSKDSFAIVYSNSIEIVTM